MNPFVRFLIASTLLFWLDVQLCMADITEGQIKAAYVLNFVKFTEWPDGIISNDDNVTLCVVGSNALNGALAKLDGSSAGVHKLHVVQYPSENFLAWYQNADRVFSSCQVMFIGESEQRHFVPIIKSLGNSLVLTISDIDDFAEKGGCIGLRYQQNKIIFDVNMASLKKSKLRLPGQLLNLASYVFWK